MNMTLCVHAKQKNRRPCGFEIHCNQEEYVEKKKDVVKDLNLYKRHAIEAARDLQYGTEVIAKIKKATSEACVTNILVDARRAM